MGETTNVQMYSPEIVVGYIMIFDVSKDQPDRRDGSWFDVLSQRLSSLSGRRAPSWSVGMIEAAAVVKVDFLAGPRLLTTEDDLSRFFDELVAEVIKRNPSLRPSQ